MVTPRGFEPLSPNAAQSPGIGPDAAEKADSKPSTTEPPEERGAQCGVPASFAGPEPVASEAPSDPNLARLLAAWPSLPAYVKRCLAELAEGSCDWWDRQP